MAFDFLVDRDTNDLVFEKGTLKLTTSKPEILRQRLSVTFKTWTGEWFNNTAFGAIDRDFLFRHGVTQAEVDAFFKTIVLSFSEVNSIVDWESEIDFIRREYDLKYVVATDFGNVQGFTTTERPDVEVTYVQVPAPEDSIACDFDDLVSLANRLHIVINEDYINPGWIFNGGVLNPLGLIYTDRIIEV